MKSDLVFEGMTVSSKDYSVLLKTKNDAVLLRHLGELVLLSCNGGLLEGAVISVNR